MGNNYFGDFYPADFDFIYVRIYYVSFLFLLCALLCVRGSLFICFIIYFSKMWVPSFFFLMLDFRIYRTAMLIKHFHSVALFGSISVIKKV